MKDDALFFGFNIKDHKYISSIHAPQTLDGIVSYFPCSIEASKYGLN
jgi:hypothetical protein